MRVRPARVALLCTSVMVLTACGSVRFGRFDAHCDAMCFQTCTGKDGDTGVRWDVKADDPAAWDTLGDDVTSQLASQVRTCEVRRQACAQCLQRLQDAKVINP